MNCDVKPIRNGRDFEVNRTGINIGEVVRIPRESWEKLAKEYQKTKTRGGVSPQDLSAEFQTRDFNESALYIVTPKGVKWLVDKSYLQRIKDK